MTVTSQNGYTANDRSLIAAFTIPRTSQKISLRKGDTSVILLDLLGWIHLRIEPLDVGIFDDWGYAERTIRGSATTLSNHASGTAADANATQHPLGVRATWTEEERALINARLALYEGCVRWGDNYQGRVDGMHFEIDRGAADCRRIADRIRSGQLATVAPALSGVATQTQKDDDLMAPIPIAVGPDGRFRATVMVEAGASSLVVERSWVTFGSTWGGSRFDVVALDAKGGGMGPAGEKHLDVANNQRAVLEVPSGAVMVTLEGHVLGMSAVPAAGLVCKPKQP